MAFRTIFAIDSLDGHAILAVSALDGDAVLAVDADSGLTILAIDADAAGSTRLTIFAILAVDSKLFSRDVLVHLDGDVAIFIDLGRQVICGVFMTVFLVGTLNLHRATQFCRIFVSRISRKLQAFTSQISSCTISDCLYIPDVGSIVLGFICIVTRCICATAHISDLATIDIDIAGVTKSNLGSGRCAVFRLLIADGLDARQFVSQLDFQLATYVVDADVLFRQLRAVRTANDIEGVVQLLVDDILFCFSFTSCYIIIASILHAVFHRSNLVFTGLVRVDDTSQARSIHTILAVDAICSIIAVLDRDIDSIGAILAVRPGRASQADVAFRAILAIDSFHSHAILAVLACDGDAVLAIDTDTGLAILAFDADAAGLTVFAILAVYSQFFNGHILVHEDRDVAIFINLRGQVISGVFMALCLLRALNCYFTTELCGVVISFIGSEGEAFVCQIVLSRFQLAYIDCIGIIDTGSDMDDTAFFILITDGKDTTVIITFQKIVNFYLAIGT